MRSANTNSNSVSNLIMIGLFRPFLSRIILLFAVCRAHDSRFKYAQDTLETEYGKIKFSAMVFRHGDRFACGDFPTNEHSELFKTHEGLLTEAGRIRAHTLGRWTHMRYDFLIGKEPYDAELLNMISSPSGRVVLSGRLFLAGFYRPNSEDHQEMNAPWEPIPMPENDRMMTMKEYCSRYNLEIEFIKRSPLFLAELNHQLNGEVMRLIELRTGLTITKGDPIVEVAKVSLLYDTLLVINQLKLKPPAWMPEIHPLTHNCAVMFFQLHTFNHEMRRLKAGPLLGHIVNELKTIRDRPHSKKLLQFYSGHDSNIVALLDALNIWDGVLAQYGSAIFFELRKLGDQLIVTVSYRNSEERPPVLLNMPDCPNPCTLNNFIQFTTEMLIPEDWDKECETKDYNRVLF